MKTTCKQTARLGSRLCRKFCLPPVLITGTREAHLIIITFRADFFSIPSSFLYFRFQSFPSLILNLLILVRYRLVDRTSKYPIKCHIPHDGINAEKFSRSERREIRTFEFHRLFFVSGAILRSVTCSMQISCLFTMETYRRTSVFLVLSFLSTLSLHLFTVLHANHVSFNFTFDCHPLSFSTTDE